MFHKSCALFWEAYSTVKLGITEQTGFKELFTDYQPFYIKSLLSDKELSSIFEMLKLGLSERQIRKISRKSFFYKFLDQYQAGSPA